MSTSPQRAPPPPAINIAHTTSTSSPTSNKLKGRARSGSLVKVEEIKESLDDVLDQSVYSNVNQEWVNRKGQSIEWCHVLIRTDRNLTRLGAWLIHPVLILGGKLIFDLVPGISQDISWTLTNIGYMAVSLSSLPPPARVAHNRPLPVDVPHVPSCHRHSIPLGSAWRRI